MTVFNHIKANSGWDVKILATDISTRILQKAIDGTYKTELLKDVPPGITSAHFSKVSVDKTNYFRAKDHLKNIITFRRFNLMTETFPFKNPFDFIFCRNVMIYFDPETQNHLVKKFYKCLPKSGYLFIGHSETLSKTDNDFIYVQPAIYQK